MQNITMKDMQLIMDAFLSDKHYHRFVSVVLSAKWHKLSPPDGETTGDVMWAAQWFGNVYIVRKTSDGETIVKGIPMA